MFFSQVAASFQAWWREWVVFFLFLFGKDDANPYLVDVGGEEAKPLQPQTSPQQTQLQPSPPPVRFEDKYKGQFEAMVDEYVLTDEEDLQMIRDVYERVISNRKMACKNNYVMECTPLGNVWMRYNVDTEVFEYYADHTIPYRYLDTVGRRYVTVYGCKPLFVDMEEELRRVAKEGNVPIVLPKQSRKDKMLMDKIKSEQQQKKGVTASAAVVQQRTVAGKAQTQAQAAAQSSSKLVKEHANHYICMGKLSNYCPLKNAYRSSKKAKVDSNLTYRDFVKKKQPQQPEPTQPR